MLLIDGYNLLYVAGIPGRGFGIKALERSRLGLLRFLVETLTPQELAETTVVFDAKDAPPGLPRSFEYHGITVRFAAKYKTADALLEELIEAEQSPRQLTVVSSDHQVQRAARRRRARAVDSDVWHDEAQRRRKQREHPNRPASLKPIGPLLAEDVARWLEQFGGEHLMDEVIEEEQADKPGLSDAHNPFPPGYGEDLE